jgi:DNA repair ATPase RecN
MKYRKTTKKYTERIKKQHRVRRKYVDYDELPAWIRRAEDRINKMPTKKYWEKLEKFADELNKKGVDEVLFGDIK